MNPDAWVEYQKKNAGDKPRHLLVEAVAYDTRKEYAVDVGAGALTEAKFLLRQGYREVTAIDITPPFQELTVPLAQKFFYIEKSVVDYDFDQNYFDLVSAQYALPLLSEADFKTVWAKITSSLRANGIFAGQFLGKLEDWIHYKAMSFRSENEVRNFVGDTYDVIVLREQEFTEQGPRRKQWRYFDLIMRKRPVH